MKLSGRKIQLWRRRLNITQKDLAAFVCIPQPQLQRIENRQYVPYADEIIPLLDDALSYFDKHSMAAIVSDAKRRTVSVSGFIAGLQALTATDTTADFYQAKIAQAIAHMRIADSLRFRKNALPGEKLITLIFEKGHNFLMWGNPLTIEKHFYTYYGNHKKVVALELNAADAA